MLLKERVIDKSLEFIKLNKGKNKDEIYASKKEKIITKK